MSLPLTPGHVIHLAAIDVNLEPLPSHQVVSGLPATGFVELGDIGAVDIGVWEHSVGVSTDIETDEVFVVVSGRATIEIFGDNAATVNVGPGDMLRFEAGDSTRWTVSETLRKVYLIPQD